MVEGCIVYWRGEWSNGSGEKFERGRGRAGKVIRMLVAR